MSEIQSLNETLIGQAVVLKRAKLNKDMAEDIFRVVDKCRDVFFTLARVGRLYGFG